MRSSSENSGTECRCRSGDRARLSGHGIFRLFPSPAGRSGVDRQQEPLVAQKKPARFDDEVTLHRLVSGLINTPPMLPRASDIACDRKSERYPAGQCTLLASRYRRSAVFHWSVWLPATVPPWRPLPAIGVPAARPGRMGGFSRGCPAYCWKFGGRQLRSGITPAGAAAGGACRGSGGLATQPIC